MRDTIPWGLNDGSYKYEIPKMHELTVETKEAGFTGEGTVETSQKMMSSLPRDINLRRGKFKVNENLMLSNGQVNLGITQVLFREMIILRAEKNDTTGLIEYTALHKHFESDGRETDYSATVLESRISGGIQKIQIKFISKESKHNFIVEGEIEEE